MGNYIGISGLAGAGKDLFYNLLCSRLSTKTIKRYALADSLKSELRSTIRDLYNIDILNCSREDKELVRPFLVFHGRTRRLKSNGRHWIEILNDIFKENEGKSDISCITDIRYTEYEKDEVYWLKSELKGILVHVSKYTLENGEKIFQSAPNKDEKDNDPVLISAADYLVEWENFNGKDGEFQKLYPIIDKFIQWLYDTRRF